jgi:hypothetical protein
MHKLSFGCALAGAALISLSAAYSAESAMMPASAMKPAVSAASDRKLITSAMSAAPRAVAANATIVVMGADGSMRTVREGKGSFTCMPDNPTTPGPDPMCMDRYAMDWVKAWETHKLPTPGRVGFIYMLAGGTDASNTDPYATQPTATNHWIKTGSHVMVVGADAAYYYAYPRSADPDTTAPYVMWPGTPYQHTMIPVK